MCACVFSEKGGRVFFPGNAETWLPTRLVLKLPPKCFAIISKVYAMFSTMPSCGTQTRCVDSEKKNSLFISNTAR